MKLAIFFIIVGISSCFVDADHVQDCQQKMNHGQAQSIVAHLIQVLALSHKIKDITDECGIRSCWESIIFLIKLIAAATNCPYDAICWTVVTNLPQSHSAQAKQIHNLLLTVSVEGLIDIKISVTVLADTATHTVRTLLPTHGHNCDDLATGTVLSLGGTISEMGQVVNSLTSCGLKLDIITETIDDVTTLIPGTGSAILCGGGLGALNLNNVPGLVVQLLGPVAAVSSLNSLNTITGGSLTGIIDTLLGGLGGLGGLGSLAGGLGGLGSLAGGLGGLGSLAGGSGGLGSPIGGLSGTINTVLGGGLTGGAGDLGGLTGALGGGGRGGGLLEGVPLLSGVTGGLGGLGGLVNLLGGGGGRAGGVRI